VKRVVISEPRPPTPAELARHSVFTPDWTVPKWLVEDNKGTVFHGETAEEAISLAKQFHGMKS
jgi:hypothetical protein